MTDKFSKYLTGFYKNHNTQHTLLKIIEDWESNPNNGNIQSWPKYMRQTLLLVWNSALREKFNFNFWTVFAGIDKIFILGEDSTLGYNSVKIWDLLNIS